LILELLKARTRLHHERAEAALPLMDDGLTLDRYRDTLVSFLGVDLPLEERLAAQHAWSAMGFDFDRRRKTRLIDRDLIALGLSADDVAIIPLCPDLPPVDTLPRALGALYVMEGATLGGQVIRKRLARTLGLDATDGVAFFSSYGDRVGSMWREFRDLARRSITTPDARDDMIASAAATFDTLTSWITRAPVHDDA
jgi:heme oxygenase